MNVLVHPVAAAVVFALFVQFQLCSSLAAPEDPQPPLLCKAERKALRNWLGNRIANGNGKIIAAPIGSSPGSSPFMTKAKEMLSADVAAIAKLDEFKGFILEEWEEKKVLQRALDQAILIRESSTPPIKSIEERIITETPTESILVTDLEFLYKDSVKKDQIMMDYMVDALPRIKSTSSATEVAIKQEVKALLAKFPPSSKELELDAQDIEELTGRLVHEVEHRKDPVPEASDQVCSLASRFKYRALKIVTAIYGALKT